MGNACSSGGKKQVEHDPFINYIRTPKLCRDTTVWGILGVLEDSSQKHEEYSDIELNMDEHNIGLILRDPCFNLPIKPIEDYGIYITRVEHSGCQPRVFMTDTSTFISSYKNRVMLEKNRPVELSSRDMLKLLAVHESTEGEPWRGIRFMFRVALTWKKPLTTVGDDQLEEKIAEALHDKFKEELMTQMRKDLKTEIKDQVSKTLTLPIRSLVDYQLEGRLHDKIKEELMPRMRKDLKKEIKTQVSKTIALPRQSLLDYQSEEEQPGGLHDKIKEELMPRIIKDLKKEIKAQISKRQSLDDYQSEEEKLEGLHDKIKEELKPQIKKILKKEIKAQVSKTLVPQSQSRISDLISL